MTGHGAIPKYHVIINPSPEGGFSGQCLELAGAISEGDPGGLVYNENRSARGIAKTLYDCMTGLVRCAGKCIAFYSSQ
ncbi:MAG: hypothetical protein WBZ36_10535 [Candidatus Nitrosopolaris sp.]